MSDLPTNPGDESSIFNISVRAVITVMLVGCVCAVCTWGAISSRDFEVHEPMYSLVMLTVGFFFGQKPKI
jgi:uncharacterized membrane protein